jgi:hypothetical protein
MNHVHSRNSTICGRVLTHNEIVDPINKMTDPARTTPLPPTETLNPRFVFSETQARLRPVTNKIQTREQFDRVMDVLDGLS